MVGGELGEVLPALLDGLFDLCTFYEEIANFHGAK